MNPGDIYYEYIHSLLSLGFITGYSDNTFRPNNAISRTEFLKLLFLVQGVSLSQDETNYFCDVGVNSWQKKYINTALNLKLISLENKKFFPDSSITKVEAIKMTILLFVGNINNVYSQKINDVSGNEWFAKYIEYTLNHNLITLENNYFYPNKDITRYEVIGLLYKISHNK